MKIVHVEDYYEKIKEKFPDLSIKQIDEIIKFGMRSFYKFNAYGADVYLKTKYICFYIGKFFKSTKIFIDYWKKKKQTKNRILYKMDKTRWDGYYYFGLDNVEFNKYKGQIDESGRRRKKITFNNIKMFKLLEDVKSENFNHIFRVKYPIESDWVEYYREYTTRNFDYILKWNKNTKKYEPVSYE